MTDYSHGMQKKLAMAAAVIHGPKVLFLDEPFEGVDAIAAGTLKAMLQGMIARGATIFLTSHVLEIVERLCSHVRNHSSWPSGGAGSAGRTSRRRSGTDAGSSRRRLGTLWRKDDSGTDFSAHRGRHASNRAGALMAGIDDRPADIAGHLTTREIPYRL